MKSFLGNLYWITLLYHGEHFLLNKTKQKMIYYILAYILLYIISYYIARYIIKINTGDYDWGDFRFNIFFSLFTVIYLLVIAIVRIKLPNKPPKWL